MVEYYCLIAKFKNNIKKLTKWYTVQLEKLGVDVRLNTEITGDESILEECDNIIIGCGAVPVTPPIPTHTEILPS